MKYYAFFTLLFIGCYSCTSTETSHQEEWIALFNGKDLSDWTIKFANQDLNVNHRNTFRAQDSMIRIAYDQYDSFNDAYAHMYYNKPYSYYKLRFDYRFTGEQVKGGEDWNVRNSGIMLHSQSAESNDYGQYFPVSIEIQLLGGLGEAFGDSGGGGDACFFSCCANEIGASSSSAVGRSTGPARAAAEGVRGGAESFLRAALASSIVASSASSSATAAASLSLTYSALACVRHRHITGKTPRLARPERARREGPGSASHHEPRARGTGRSVASA